MKSKPAFDELVLAHGAELFAYLWRMVGEVGDAEECLQDTYLRAFRAFSKLEAGGNYRAWLYTIATNVARTFLKRRSREASRRAALDPALVAGGATPLEDLTRRERLQAIASAVETLPYKQRAALVLRKFQGMGYDEIAKTLGSNEATARANVYQALKKLRAMLIPEIHDMKDALE